MTKENTKQEVKEVKNNNIAKDKTKNRVTKPTKGTNTSPTSKASNNKQKQAQNIPKKLTLSAISELSKKAQKYKEITLLDGAYKITVHENFLDGDIHNFVLDVQEAALTLKSENVSMKDTSNYFVVYQMLLLKHFSDTPLKHIKMTDKKGFSKMLSVAEELIKIGVFQQISEFFDKEELDKINEAVGKIEGASKIIGDMFVKATLNEQDRLAEMGLEVIDGLDGDVGDDYIQ